MGEAKLKRLRALESVMPSAVQTAGGRVQVRWETESAATPMGQLAYFIEFLTLTGLWTRWQESYPLVYASPNAPSKAEILGTWTLSILAGHRRYAHVAAIRCDGVNPGLLGMRKVISEDALRRALAVTPGIEGVAWLDQHLNESVAALLDAPWILDIDTTVKPLYGKQEGAVVSYNPKKPGRPSHTYHTYLMAGLRLVVGAEVRAGNEHSGSPTHDLHRCQLSARAVALIYNWWSLFVRLANPQARREAITSRPWLMSSVGRKTEHAGQTTITLTGLHAEFAKARDALMRVSALLQGWTIRAAEQFNPSTVWSLVCDHLKRVLAAIAPTHARRALQNHALGAG